MATPGPSAPVVNVGIFPNEGIDFSAVYVINVNSSGGTGYAPEFPRPPFLPGQHAFGSNGTEYVFCQVGANSAGSPNGATASTIIPWAAVQIDPQGFFATPLNTTGFFNKWFFGINASGNTATFTNTSTIATYFWAAVRGSNLAVLTGTNCTAFSHYYGQLAATSAGRVTSLAAPASYVVTGIAVTQSIGNTTSTALGNVPVQLYASWPRMSTANTASGFFAE